MRFCLGCNIGGTKEERSGLEKSTNNNRVGRRSADSKARRAAKRTHLQPGYVAPQ